MADYVYYVIGKCQEFNSHSNHACNVCYSHCFLYIQNKNHSSRVCHSSLLNFQTQYIEPCLCHCSYLQLYMHNSFETLYFFRYCNECCVQLNFSGVYYHLVILFYSVSDFHLFQLAACRPHSAKPKPTLLACVACTSIKFRISLCIDIAHEKKDCGFTPNCVLINSVFTKFNSTEFPYTSLHQRVCSTSGERRTSKHGDNKQSVWSDGEGMYFWQLCMGSSFHRYISWSQANCKVNWVTKKALHLQIVFVDIELLLHRRVLQPSDLEQHYIDLFTFRLGHGKANDHLKLVVFCQIVIVGSLLYGQQC